jgi:adenylyltransferase and sulfurtransferase
MVGPNLIFALDIVTDLRIDGVPSLLLFSALRMPPFRTIRLRSRRSDCQVCSSDGKNVDDLRKIDYIQLCGGPMPNWFADGQKAGLPGTRVSPQVIA